MVDHSRKFKVVLGVTATQELLAAYENAAKHAPGPAARWLERFQLSIQSLGENAEGCPVAFQAQRLGIDLREMLFGKRPNVFRVLFRIVESEVQVMRIRRSSRRKLTRREIRHMFDVD